MAGRHGFMQWNLSSTSGRHRNEQKKKDQSFGDFLIFSSLLFRQAGMMIIWIHIVSGGGLLAWWQTFSCFVIPKRRDIYSFQGLLRWILKKILAILGTKVRLWVIATDVVLNLRVYPLILTALAQFASAHDNIINICQRNYDWSSSNKTL